MQTNKVIGLVLQVNNLIKKYSTEHNLNIVNSFTNMSDYMDGSCIVIGKQIEIKVIITENQ